MQTGTTREVLLLGQPSLDDYLGFVADQVIDGETVARRKSVDEWRSANDYYQELEENEADIADEIGITDLEPHLQPLVERAMDDPHYQFTFDKLPTSFAMVELDRLIICQNFVNLEHSAMLQKQIDSEPDPQTLFKFCMPPASPGDSVKIRSTGRGRYTFSSESTDFRAHSPTVLTPEQISDFKTFGPLSGMVGIGVGFGSNFLTGIRVEDRVLLHNGYHRVHAMRSKGITHAPCILQTATRMDELEIAAKRIVLKDSNFYFGAPRPPLFKDFFDPRIRREFQIHKTIKTVEVSFEIKELHVRV